MSMGVNLLAALVRQAPQRRCPDFDIEIVEMHHRKKVDAPSGTALLLGQAAAESRGISLGEKSVRARDGHTGARPDGAIGFASLRGGTVIGEHEVIFAGPAASASCWRMSPRIAASSRTARSRAAQWGQGKKPGLYAMADVLGLSD